MPDRVKVIQQLRFILCGFECCSFVLVSAINSLFATMYWILLNWQDTIYATLRDNAANIVLTAFLFTLFALLISLTRLFYWRWAGKNELRLQLFVIVSILGTVAPLSIILGLLFRPFCTSPNLCSGGAYNSIQHLQVRLQDCTFQVLTD